MVLTFGILHIEVHFKGRSRKPAWRRSCLNQAQWSPEETSPFRVTMWCASAITEDNAWANIQAKGFWGTSLHCAFFDVNMSLILTHHPTGSSPSPPVCQSQTDQVMALWTTHPWGRAHLSLHLHLFSSTGGNGESAAVFSNCLANMISAKKNQLHAATLTWIQCTLNFYLIGLSVTWLRWTWHRHSLRLPVLIQLTDNEARIWLSMQNCSWTYFHANNRFLLFHSVQVCMSAYCLLGRLIL